MNTPTEIFGSMVFNDTVMRQRLPKEVFRQVQRSMKDGRRLDSAAAIVVANAMCLKFFWSFLLVFLLIFL